MNELLNVNVLTMSSREMATLTETRHDSVKRTIDTLFEKGIIRSPQIVNFKNINNVDGIEYLVEKRDSFIIVAQLSPEFTAKLVDRWQELEAVQPVLPTTYIAALEALVISEKEKSAIAALLELQAPKVEIANMLIADAKLLSISEALAHYSINRSAGFDMLKMCKWIYKKEQYDRVKTSIWLPTELARKNNWLILKQRCDEKGYTRPQTLVTGVGLTEMRKIFY